MRSFEERFALEVSVCKESADMMRTLGHTLPEGAYLQLVEALRPEPGQQQTLALENLSLEAVANLVWAIPYANIRRAAQGVVLLLERQGECSARISYTPAQRTLDSDWIASLSVMLGFTLDKAFSQDFDSFCADEDASWIEC